VGRALWSISGICLIAAGVACLYGARADTQGWLSRSFATLLASAFLALTISGTHRAVLCIRYLRAAGRSEYATLASALFYWLGVTLVFGVLTLIELRRLL